MMLKTALLSSPARKGALAFCAVAALAVAALSPASSAQRQREPDLVDTSTPNYLDFAVTKAGVPNLASIQFPWLSIGAEWMGPPAGTPGHGPIKHDPDRPF